MRTCLKQPQEKAASALNVARLKVAEAALKAGDVDAARREVADAFPQQEQPEPVWGGRPQEDWRNRGIWSTGANWSPEDEAASDAESARRQAAWRSEARRV